MNKWIYRASGKKPLVGNCFCNDGNLVKFCRFCKPPICYSLTKPFIIFLLIKCSKLFHEDIIRKWSKSFDTFASKIREYQAGTSHKYRGFIHAIGVLKRKPDFGYVFLFHRNLKSRTHYLMNCYFINVFSVDKSQYLPNKYLVRCVYFTEIANS